MNSYERKRRICKVIVLVLGILSINNIILTIRNYSYAYFEKNVKTGVKLKITTLDKMPSKEGLAIDIVKSKVVNGVTDTCESFTEKGGLVAINTEGTLYQEGQEIREYRYVGPDVDNYIYFNCEDNKVPTADTCEMWRILGIFKDEKGEEHLKIVKNNILTRDMYPVTFEANGTTYNIQSTSSGDYAYWNKGKYSNDWSTAGLQYWLNAGSDKETKTAGDGYMSYLSKNAKGMIEETKYYLGTAMEVMISCDSASSSSIVLRDGTTLEIYQNERTINEVYSRDEISVPCQEYSRFPAYVSRKGGKLWPNNSGTGSSNVSIMYVSDYGYTANSCNWSKSIRSSANSSNWFYITLNHNSDEWLLSPSPESYNDVNYLSTNGVIASMTTYNSGSVRPTIYLKSQVIIYDGNGSSENPYRLKLEN